MASDEYSLLPPKPAREITDNTPLERCIFCHEPISWNEKRTGPDGIEWESAPPKGSDYKPEALGWTHLGSCAEGNKQACQYLGMEVHPFGHKLVVSFNG